MIGRRVAAEALGTFMIVFAPMAASAAHADLSIAAAVSGLSVLAMIFALGPISSAHFNPAVTLAFASVGRFPRREIAPYVAAQFAGGIGAAALGAWIFGGGFGAHVPASTAWGANVGMELILTFTLMFVIMAVATNPRVHAAVPPIAIGATVVLGVLMGGPFTGGSMNPARSLGPALFNSSALAHVGLYLIVPPLGALVAAQAYERLRTS